MYHNSPFNTRDNASSSLPYPLDATIPDSPLTQNEEARISALSSPSQPKQPPKPIRRKPVRQSAWEDDLEFLRNYDTVFLIDDSASMQSHWHEVGTLLSAISDICVEYDRNGIDIYFINHRPRGYLPIMVSRKSGYERIGQVASATGMRDNVKQIFDDVKPKGKCHLGRRLHEVVELYVARSIQHYLVHGEWRYPSNVIVITAGQTHVGWNDGTVKGALVSLAKQLDRASAPKNLIGVQIFQVGKDPEVRECLRWIDDEMHKKKGVRDMVDTVTWDDGEPGVLTAEKVFKVVAGAVSRYDGYDVFSPEGGLVPEGR